MGGHEGRVNGRDWWRACTQVTFVSCPGRGASQPHLLPLNLERDPGRVTTDKTASWWGSHPENLRNRVGTCGKK